MISRIRGDFPPGAHLVPRVPVHNPLSIKVLTTIIVLDPLTHNDNDNDNQLSYNDNDYNDNSLI